MRYWKLLSHASIIAALAAAFISSGCSRPIGKLEKSNRIFKVRIIEYEVKNFPLNSFTHVLETSPIASDKWTTVISYDSDDGFEIKPEQIHFVNDNVGYAFMANWYTVTIDGGKSWAKHPFTQGWVREVNITADSQGSLKLEVYSIEKNKEVMSFDTKDFGCTWNLVTNSKPWCNLCG